MMLNRLARDLGIIDYLNRRERVSGVAVPPGKLAVGAESAERII